MGRVANDITTAARKIAKVVLPAEVLRWLREKRRRWSAEPPIDSVLFGDLRRLVPICAAGWDRGRPIDRHYIENFLAAHAEDVHGHVLEIGDDTYTRRFGGTRVVKSDVLHVWEGNPQATIVADLTSAPGIDSNTFDCIVLTHVLNHIFDVGAALQTVCRILRPRGVVLATLPALAQTSRYDRERWGDWWRFTAPGARRLFEQVFPADAITAEAYGNVLAATAFMYGIATEELRPDELAYRDPDYPVVITVRAVKPGGAAAGA